ncbi:hypothetical protein COV23_01805 [Candidatus Wolfebacteria bacterium CG10_big_fil_rev_8_21_14_0_10_31_9]|uniref:Alpha/beta hydrolase n=1 Tax=Candidatus Wolfebacteria bacterium CG10_big_fil_rev_8_21_14_0_10_31_9 TaxID=1975070 RepID=A0A2H0RC28_9BACT|nr:MAG: hypothetical protein COV23_01805 [Candidatus Wolfebacteria bacterium CG10_big_fil_rev_8_21_14_0_10_31_9]
MKNRIVFIIPGFLESHLKQKGYNKIAEFFKERNIKPVHVNIDWISKKPYKFRNYIRYVLKEANKYKNSEIYVLGFSYGAIIALLSEFKLKPKTLILCSLSPYFIEDFKTLEQSWLKWWKKNFKDSDYSFNEIAPKIKARTYLIVGAEEGKECLKRAKDARKRIKNSDLIIIKEAKHKINQRIYLEVVKKIVYKL